MKKQLRKPENWQDFESLCKVLWGEIWSSPEIKKNGRSGQEQHGVDVYGVPSNESEYFGIQCKGKDDYAKSKLTKSEVDEEVVKAKLFKPALKKFYFATSANKDTKIEEYVRLKDQESRKNGEFEIHLFSWEDIVDLIDENKRTHNWYVKNIGFKVNHSVRVFFHGQEQHLVFAPKLVRNQVNYKKIESRENGYIGMPFMSPDFNREDRIKKLYSPQPKGYYLDGESDNESSCVFAISILNNGNVPLENFKLYLTFPDEGITVDTVDKQRYFLDQTKYTYNTIMFKDSNNCVFEPSEQILVQKDRIVTDQICLRPTLEEAQDINIKFELVAKDFDCEGQLSMRLETVVEDKMKIEESAIERESEVRLENSYK